MIPVTRVTANATADELSEQDYREIYEDNREGRGIRLFVDRIQSAYSIAWWSKYERGEAQLTRQAKNELRRLVGLPELALTVEEATAAVDPDAEVWRIGEDLPNRVILVGHPEALALSVNGTVAVVENPGEDAPPGHAVTAVTRPRSVSRRKKVSLSTQLFDRLNTARVAAHMTWPEFLGQLLEE